MGKYSDYGAEADNEVASLQATLTAVNADLDKAEEQVVLAQAQLDNANAQLDIANQELVNVQEELNLANQKIEYLEHKLSLSSPIFNSILEPSYGVLWGAAGAAFAKLDDYGKHKDFENKMGGVAPIAHSYVVGDSPLPSDPTLALRDEGRTVLVNWKVAAGTTWAAVAKGTKDARIDAAANRLKTVFEYDENFFLAIHHEPENDVNTTAGSGMTPADYKAMFRYTVNRLRSQGVEGMITIYNPMAYYGWVTKSWFEDLYPGDDVVDWIGMDLYVQASSSKPRTLANMLNKQAGATKYSDGTTYQGAYAHMVRLHPNKPLMLCEWGYQQDTVVAGDQAAFYNDVVANLDKYPNLKGLVYFNDYIGSKPTDIANSPDALNAWKSMVASPAFISTPEA